MTEREIDHEAAAETGGGSPGESRESPYSDDERRRMLTIARGAAAAALRGEPFVEKAAPNEVYLVEPRGCFVTLTGPAGELRGCIGTFDDARPLIDNLIDMAGESTRDPRFVDAPVTLEELDRLNVELSILTPREPIEDPTAMEIGRDGVYIVGRIGGRRVGGCFLPEVAAEQGWDAETTLSACCAHKMGLAPDAWRPPTRLQFFRFQSIKVSDEPR